MNETQWRDFLHELSRLLLDIDIKEGFDELLFSPEDHARGYIGFEGATEEQIIAVEERLGARLPDSYRTFLKVSNGWPLMRWNGQPGALWAVEHIQWVRDYDPFGVVDYGLQALPYGSPPDLSAEEHLQARSQNSPDAEDDPGEYRMAYVDNLLSISDVTDNCQLLISPEVLDEDSEWECWKIASWLPGALRYQSFEKWMIKNYDSLQEYLETIEG